jgi:hypothetical protein
VVSHVSQRKEVVFGIDRARDWDMRCDPFSGFEEGLGENVM